MIIKFPQANSSVHRAALLGAVRMHKLNSDANFSLRGETLTEAIEKDKKEGMIPFFVRILKGISRDDQFKSRL